MCVYTQCRCTHRHRHVGIHMCMWVCIHVCTRRGCSYICVCSHVSVSAHVCQLTCAWSRHTHTHTHTTHTHTTHTHTHTYTHTHTQTHVSRHICEHTHTHTISLSQTHTHNHADKRSSCNPLLQTTTAAATPYQYMYKSCADPDLGMHACVSAHMCLLLCLT